MNTQDVDRLGTIDLTNSLADSIAKWKNDIISKLNQKGVLEKLVTDVSHVLERTQSISPNPNNDVNISYQTYKTLYQEIQGSVHLSLSRDINQIVDTDEKLRNSMKSEITEFLNSNKDVYQLETDNETIRQNLTSLESTFSENKKDKKPKKRRVEEIPDDEPFITCGRVNSRGRPCMRRQGTCPYHSMMNK